MSMHYEGVGIMLNIDRIVRCVFASLVEGGQTKFEIPQEMILDSPWQNYDLTSHFDMMQDCYIVTVRDRTKRVIETKVDDIQDAEYTIEPNQATLPPATKMLPP